MMKKTTVLLLCAMMMTAACNQGKTGSASNDADSIVYDTVMVDTVATDTADEDIRYLGMWKVENRFQPDYSMTILIGEKEGKYFSIENGRYRGLIRKGNRFIIQDEIGNRDELYILREDGSLRMADKEGDFTDKAGYVITAYEAP